MAALTRVSKFSCLRVPELAGSVCVVKRHKATEISLSNYQRGTGGRSSFSGIVATVFGAKSCLGYPVVNRLGKIGSQVIIPYRGDPIYMRDLKVMGDLGQILFNEFELRDEESIRKCMQYSNVVINLIGQDYETRNFSFKDVHVDGARRLARIAKECGVERFIHVSALNAGLKTSNIVKDGSKWLASKAEGELAVREEFPEAIIMRPTDLIDLNDRFFRYYQRSPRGIRSPNPFNFFKWSLPLWKNGEETVKIPVRASDVARGIVAAIRDPNAPGQTYQCVGKHAYKLHDIVQYIYDARDKEVRFSRQFHRVLFRTILFEKIYKRLGFLTPVTSLDRLERVSFCGIHLKGNLKAWLFKAGGHLIEETISDQLDSSLPTLTDLGIKPENIEEYIRHCQKVYVNAALWQLHYGRLHHAPEPERQFATV